MQLHFDNRIHMPRRGMILGAASALISVWLNVQPALAADASRDYRIPAQSLNDALMTFAADSGLEVVFNPDGIRGLNANSLNGRMTPAEALDRLLQGSGYTWRFVNDRIVTLEKRPAQADPSSKVNTLPPMRVTGAAEYDSTDPYNTEYTVQNSSTATKTDTPIMETPVSVQVVSRAVMDDQKSTRIKDALENVSGVRARPTLGLGTNFIIRGFQNGRVYRNGLLFGHDGFGLEFDAGNLQNIEVLKGPAAVLYGRIEPGGLINVTTKKPLDIPYYSLEQQFGSYDSYRTQWDATGAITDDKSLLYRFTGSYQNNESFRDFIFTDRVLVNPSLTWRPTDRTDITVSVEHSDQDYQADVGVPAIGTRPAAIPISRSLDDPNSPIDNSTHTLVSTEMNHHFNDDWAIHNRFLAGFTDTYSAFITRSPTVNGPGEDGLGPDGILRRNIFGQTTDGESFATNLDLTGKFRLGFTTHDVLVGFDYYQAMNTYVTSGEYILPNPALDIDIFNPAPSYGIDPALIQSTLSRNMAYSFFKTDWYGAYFQDHITLWDKLHILGGGRYDWSTTGRGRGASLSAAEADLPLHKDQGFSPRVGILYQPWTQLGIYGNWTTSFSANNAPAANGATFDPQTGEQFEAGVKTQLFDDRLIATLAYYHLTKDNILVNDQSTPDIFDKIANKQRSQGIELDVTGQITDRLSLIGSYAYTDAKVIEDHVGSTAGNRMPNVPDHSGSLFVKYDMNGYEAQEGFSFGVGGVAAGQRQTDFDNTSQLPGFIRVDAFAAYRMKVGPTRVTTQFNIRNLLDKTYYESTDPNANAARPYLAIAPGAPLTAIGSIRVEY